MCNRRCNLNEIRREIIFYLNEYIFKYVDFFLHAFAVFYSEVIILSRFVIFRWLAVNLLAFYCVNNRSKWIKYVFWKRLIILFLYYWSCATVIHVFKCHDSLGVGWGKEEIYVRLSFLIIYSMLPREDTMVIFEIILLDNNFFGIPNILPIGMLLWKAGTGGIIKFVLIFVLKCI